MNEILKIIFKEINLQKMIDDSWNKITKLMITRYIFRFLKKINLNELGFNLLL